MADAPAELKERRLDQLKVGDEGLLILARVLRAERRDVVRRSDGGRRAVLTGLLSDNSATVRFTWWDPPAHGDLESGTVFRAGPVSVREFRGKAELAFNWRTRFAEASEQELPPLAVGDLPARRLIDLRAGEEGFRLDVRVLRVGDKLVSVGETRRQIQEGVVGDRSGTLEFTAWTPLALTAGRAVRLSGGYVRPYRDRPQLVLDERSHLDPLADDAVPALDHWQQLRPTIAEIDARGGGALVTLVGRVVGLAPPSGLVHRCPECRRTVRDGRCRVHGAVDGRPDLRARAILDDGTGVAVVQLERADTEREWGHDLAEAVARADRGDSSSVEDELWDRLLGRSREVRGRASKDEFGLTVYPEAWSVPRRVPSSTSLAGGT